MCHISSSTSSPNNYLSSRNMQKQDESLDVASTRTTSHGCGDIWVRETTMAGCKDRCALPCVLCCHDNAVFRVWYTKPALCPYLRRSLHVQVACAACEGDPSDSAPCYSETFDDVWDDHSMSLWFDVVRQAWRSKQKTQRTEIDRLLMRAVMSVPFLAVIIAEYASMSPRATRSITFSSASDSCIPAAAVLALHCD